MLQQKSYTPGARAQRRKAKWDADHKHHQEPEFHAQKQDVKRIAGIITFVLIVILLLVLVPMLINGGF